jgi:hypothetical protein
MPITYTNRKGVTFYLCQGVTRTGTVRYFFAREPKGQAIEQIPPGYVISESVNGVVSLVAEKPPSILSSEIELVQSVLQQHPKSGNYRVAVKGKEIVIHERVGPDPADLMAALSRAGLFRADASRQKQAGEIAEELGRNGRFTPALQFILVNEDKRSFCVECWRHFNGTNRWLPMGKIEKLENLARHWIPRLGTHAFFEDDEY